LSFIVKLIAITIADQATAKNAVYYFGLVNDTLNILYSFEFLLFLPPTTWHFNAIMSPSLYGPTTVERSTSVLSRIMTCFGGAVIKKIRSKLQMDGHTIE